MKKNQKIPINVVQKRFNEIAEHVTRVCYPYNGRTRAMPPTICSGIKDLYTEPKATQEDDNYLLFYSLLCIEIPD